jgi:hypothetical protein
MVTQGRANDGEEEMILVVMLVHYDMSFFFAAVCVGSWPGTCAHVLCYIDRPWTVQASGGAAGQAGRQGRFYPWPHIFNGIIDEITGVLVGQAMSIFIIIFLIIIISMLMNEAKKIPAKKKE